MTEAAPARSPRDDRDDVDRLWDAVEAIEQALWTVRRRLHALEARLRWPPLAPSPGTPTPLPYGAELRVRRVALGLTQAALARSACCSRGLVSDLERGRRVTVASRIHVGAVLGQLEGRPDGRPRGTWMGTPASPGCRP
jgi:hypothetical protein